MTQEFAKKNLNVETIAEITGLTMTQLQEVQVQLN